MHNPSHVSLTTVKYWMSCEQGADFGLRSWHRSLTLRSTYRHGWGCPPDPVGAVHFLSAAASNAASVEQLALQAGLKKGGAAKGELVLAIFELANCFRHGWGIPKDPVAAKQVCRVLRITVIRSM